MQLKQTKDIAIEELCTERGDLLQVLSNLTAREQVTMIHTCLVGRRLGSRYMQSVGDMLLRSTVGWHGRGRDDIVTIAKSDKGEGAFQEDGRETQRRSSPPIRTATAGCARSERVPSKTSTSSSGETDACTSVGSCRR